MTGEARQQALQDVRENIDRFGYHLYIVSGKQTPRYAYTIGLSTNLGYELATKERSGSEPFWMKKTFVVAR